MYSSAILFTDACYFILPTYHILDNLAAYKNVNSVLFISGVGSPATLYIMLLIGVCSMYLLYILL